MVVTNQAVIRGPYVVISPYDPVSVLLGLSPAGPHDSSKERIFHINVNSTAV